MKILYSILFLCAFTTVSISQNLERKKAGNCFTMEMPSYMAKTFDLNDVAILQYTNAVMEAYVVVIDDSKEELNSLKMIFQSPTDFLTNFTDTYQLDAEKRSISETREFESNENQHSQLEMTWSEGETSFYMLITVVETKEHYYKILCWTLLRNKELLKKDYLAISKSLID